MKRYRKNYRSLMACIVITFALCMLSSAIVAAQGNAQIEAIVRSDKA